MKRTRESLMPQSQTEALQMIIALPGGRQITVAQMSDTQFVEYLRSQSLASSPENGQRYFEEEYGDIGDHEWRDPDVRWWALDNLQEIRKKAYLASNNKKYHRAKVQARKERSA